MGLVYKQVLRFKKKYPLTIGWRLRANTAVVEKHLNPDEEPLYSFIAQKNDKSFNFWESAVVTLTNKRLVVGRKRVIFGYFFDTITPDMFNDLKVVSGIVWGKVYIDTIKELVTLSNIGKEAFREIETQISSYMMEMKKEYEDDDDERRRKKGL
jgi:hypothetical protein